LSDLQCPATVILAAPGMTLPAAVAEVYTPDASDGAALRAEVDALSDLHRGETIAVLAPPATLAAALGLPEPPDHAITLEIDSSGWRVRPTSTPQS
jgi:hypothetical protein